MGEERLAQPPEAEAGKRDAELGGGEAGIEIIDRLERHRHPPVALAEHRFE